MLFRSQSQKLQGLGSRKNNPRDIVTGYYLTILSRYPTPDELKTALTYSRYASVQDHDVAVDLAWALLNSAEFLYRH